MRRISLSLAAALAVATPAAAATPDLARMSAGELAATLKAFPKGGELHNHLGGGTPPELILEWAIEDGACIDPAELAIRLSCGEGLRPASDIRTNEALRSAKIGRAHV